MSQVETIAMCERMVWVTKWGRTPTCKGRCQNRATYKDEGRLVCATHARKKFTKLKVAISSREGICVPR